MPESLRILILEDNTADVELIQFELQEAGFIFNPKVVMTEEEYVQAIRDYCPDLILSDYDLPTYNGALALAEANRRCPDTPFILVTGAIVEDRAIEILTQGAKDYVLKTRLQQRLVPAVRRALAEAEEHRARKKAEEDLREAHQNLERQVAERTVELQKEIAHRSQIEAALLKYNERLELLSYTASRLLASDKPPQIVEELCLKVMEFLDCDAFFNFLVDEVAGRLHLNACAGIPAETASTIDWLDYGVAVSGCAARDACRIVAENIPMKPDVRTELVKSFGIKAYACHPLIEQNRVIGTLSFGTRSRTTFSTDDLAMMKAVADQVAIAVSRVRTEYALKESESRERVRAAELQAFLDAFPGVVFLAHDPECRKMTGGRATYDFLRLQPQANLSKSAHDGEKSTTFRAMKNGAEVPSEELPVRQAAKGREVRDYEFDIVFADGSVRTLLGNANPVFGERDNPRGAVAAFVEVTERKQAEKALRQITERLDMAQNAAQIGTWDWDVSTGHIEWSTQMFDLFGLDPERNTASFEVWNSVLHPEDIEIAGLRIDQALKQQMTLNSDYRIVLPDGQIRWINSVGRGKYDDQGRPIRMVGVCMDITERKRMEDDLRKTKAELEERVIARTSELQAASLYARSLIEASLDPLVTISADGKIMDVNHASEEATGVTRLKLIGTDFSDYFTEPEKARAGYEKVFREGFVRDYPLEMRHREGHVTPVLYNASVYRDETGKIVGIFASARDITERKRAEEALQKAYGELEKRVKERTLELTRRTTQLEEANKELESFSYSVSHDLRAPLRAIDGYAKMILRQRGDEFDEDTKRKFNQIRDNARMMGRLIDDLLALSRLGMEALSLSRLNVEDLTRDVWKEIEPVNPDRPIDLKIDHVPSGTGDRSLIRQVLANLLSNAVKFSRVREVPRIEVGGHLTETENVYYVRDNGVGFDMQYHNKLFIAFQRLHSDDDFEGTGVGLAIVQRIILRHGGRVWAESEPDKGATFYFSLPVDIGSGL